MASCNNRNVSGPVEEISVQKSFATVDDVQRNIEGTIWTYTEVGSKLWFKLVLEMAWLTSTVLSLPKESGESLLHPIAIL